MRTTRSIPGTLALMLLGLGTALAGAEVSAKVFLDQRAALALAFGEDARVERKTIFLSDDQRARARALAGKGVAVRSTGTNSRAGSTV